MAFFFCLVGGLWILKSAKFGEGGDALAIAIGFYFVGKAFFVGPMLLVAAAQLDKGAVSK